MVSLEVQESYTSLTFAIHISKMAESQKKPRENSYVIKVEQKSNERDPLT